MLLAADALRLADGKNALVNLVPSCAIPFKGVVIASVARTLDEALTVVRSFLDPLIDGSAAGTWDPRAGRWSV